MRLKWLDLASHGQVIQTTVSPDTKGFEMAWLSMLSLPPSDSQLLELAHDVAAKSQSAVQSRVQQRLGELQLSEARGYVRARSASIIRREIDLLVNSQPKLRKSRNQLHHMASEAAIRQVIWQVLRDRKQQQTAAVAARRAA